MSSPVPPVSDVHSPTRSPMTVRVARWSATHPWRAVALWVVFVAACVAVGGATSVRRVNEVDTLVGQSHQAARWLHDTHLVSPATEQVLITARGGALPAGAARAAVDELTHRMRALPEVARVDAPLTAPGGGAVLVRVTVSGDPETAKDRVAPLQRVTAAVQHDHPALRVEQAGGASVSNAVNDLVARDLGSAAGISLPVTLLILLVAFGAIIAAGVPVLLAMSAVGAATGLSTLVSHVLPDSGTTSSMILLMGMAVGVDYSLFYVKRARAERHAGRTRLDSIEIAAETAGHSVIVSGAAVIVAMTGLFLARNPIFSSLAAGSIIVVAVAVLGSLTVLPAVLVLLGRGIDRPRVPVLWRLVTQTREPRFWPALLRPATTRPARTLAVSTGVMLLLALPALGLRLHSGSTRSLPSSLAQKHTLDRLAAAFPGEQTTAAIVVRSTPGQAAAVTARLTELRDSLAGDPRFVVGDHPAPVRSSADGRIHLLEIDVPHDPESAPARAGVTALRSTLLPQATAGLDGVRWAVGGDAAIDLDVDHRLTAALPWVIGFVVLATMVIMGWVFRSPAIALTTAAVNLLSAGAAFGVLVLVFQHTWAQGLLGFTSTGAVINWIPLFTFAVLFGLSMDYHVFVISRIREAVQSGVPTREAVRVGITSSAGTITSAAVVMVSVFAIFAGLHMIEMKEMGVGLAVAVLVDALVVRAVVLPSLMTLLGRWNWWPGVPGDRRRAATSGGSGLAEGHRPVDLVGSL